MGPENKRTQREIIRIGGGWSRCVRISECNVKQYWLLMFESFIVKDKRSSEGDRQSEVIEVG